jgi:DNA polymerase-4
MNEGIRFVSLRVPALSRQLLEAARPELRGTVWVLCAQGSGAHARLDDVSGAARALGIEPGMRLSELRRRFPEAVVLPPDGRAIASFRRILSSLCEARTPVWEAGPEGALLDLSGAVHLFGGDWDAWAARLRDDLARSCGLREVHLCGAAVRGVAEILARTEAGRSGIDLCAPGCETARLDPVPVDSVGWLSRKARETLARYGIKTLGDARRQPRSFLRLHLGPDGDRVAALALGLEPDPARRSKAPSEEVVLPRDENDREVLRGAVHQLSDRLAFALRERSLGAHEIRLSLSWSDGSDAGASVRPPLPVEDFLSLREAAWKLLDQLDERRVAVRSLRLSAPRTFVLVGQEDLFATPETQRQRRLGGALDKVRRRQGFAAVGNALELA